jgi:hypothetical protein
MARTDLTIPVPGPGRSSSYDPSYADQARKLCLLGAKDAEMADFFGVSETTINNWKNAHPAFLESIRSGKVKADAEVADSLYRRATGEHVEIQKLVKKSDGSYEAMKLMQYVPGDPTAAYKWLLNRRRSDWTDQTAVIHSGAIEVQSKEQRDAAVSAALRADN